jgi:MFS family permease
MRTDAQAIARRPVISSLGLICAAQFVLQVDFSIITVALPTIQRDLGFTPVDLQWVVTGYALTFGSLLLLGGRARWAGLAELCSGPLPAHADPLALRAGGPEGRSSLPRRSRC